MNLADFDFPFEPSLVAAYPSQPRDHARLLVVPRGRGACSDSRVIDLPQILRSGDLLVVNDTRVLPVRLLGRKQPGHGRVEVLLLKQEADNYWEVFIKGKVRVGQGIRFEDGTMATVRERGKSRTTIHLVLETPFKAWLERMGTMPLPPYIKREPTEQDQTDYQTMFAAVEGAVAAPTAGLHFTPRLVEALTRKGIRLARVTLHVGPGTFRPVTSEAIENHQMEPEWFRVPQETVEAIGVARQHGGRVIAVGTTVARSLEAACLLSGDELTVQEGETNLFILPGFQFRVIDGLLTNFHLPGTTLLMLIAAFAGLEQSRQAYEHAVRQRYRFYSYGDAMLIQ